MRLAGGNLLLSLVIFYSAVSIGFSSSVQYNSNLALFDACFNYLSIQKEMSNKEGIGALTPSGDSKLEEYIIPLNSFQDNAAGNPNQLQFLQDSISVDSLSTDSLSADSLSLDSLSANGILDTTVVDSLARFRNVDSTARIKNFTHERKDRPYTLFGNRKKQSGFYVYPSESKTLIEIDSTGEYVLIKEVINNTETRIRLRIPFDEYIKLRLGANNRDAWEALAYKYELKDGKKSLESLLTDITNIEIPLPSSSILSIFGPNRINLRIGGAVDIHGAWRNEKMEGVTTSLTGNSRSEPDFKQQVQINVDGTIGDKLTIGADWNTERTFEYENQLKIKYTGYPDEIIQSIEAGNVSLQTSSLVGGSEALFGVKANFQMGPLTLTALASQKKGEIMEKSITSGSESQTFSKRAFEYSTNHYFLDPVYYDTVRNIFNKYYFTANHEYDPDYYVDKIEVWKSIITYTQNTNERNAIAKLDLPRRFQDQRYFIEIPGSQIDTVNNVERGRFIRLTESVDYDIHRETGYITIRTQVNDKEAIAVAYVRRGGPNAEDAEYFGEFSTDDNRNDPNRPLLLKLVKPKDLRPTDEAWKLQLKNIYPVGGKNINEEGFEFKILYDLAANDPQPVYKDVQLLKAFGFDEKDKSNNPIPNGDQIFDYIPNFTIMPITGEIIFPFLEPFGRDLPPDLKKLQDSLEYPEIYTELPSIARQSKDKDKFILTGKYTGVSSGTYSIGFSAVENSVKVYLNGNQLKENVDYTVDYTIGQVVIRNDAALVTGADLRITYEQNDLFQLASKTLLGLRGVFDISNRTKLGFSALSLNQETLSDKVRIGEEPLSNSIYGVDFTTGADLPFLTKAIDKIVSTNAMSSIDVRGEFAYINPDPNTKKSPISGDQDKSIAYLDDFEGVKRIIPVGVYYSGWEDLSVPDEMPNFSFNNVSKDSISDYKGNAYWFNITPSRIQVDDIWGKLENGEPRKKVGQNEQDITVLDFVYQPGERGQYNYNQNYTPSQESWGGMMRVLSSSASNLVEENVEYIEFWVNMWHVPPGAKMYIDLGKISEDVIPNGKIEANTEDFIKRNTLIDEGEDVGLDGKADVDEPGYSAANPDPANDNFAYIFGSGDFRRINRPEGNFQLTDAGGRLPDTEDLNNNGSTDLANNYFRYEIPLDTAGNPYRVGGGYPNRFNSPFYQFRIPLKEFKQKIGDPSFSFVEYIRVWVNGVTDSIHLGLTEFNLVGNQWQKVFPKVAGIEDKNDSIMAVSVVSIEDNSPIYYSPPGVERERDRSQTDEEVLRNEQSLELLLENLPNGQTREAVKYLTSSLDVFNYKEMKFFIHGDEGDISTDPLNLAHYISESDYNGEVYFRFGADTNNYYEYRQPIKPGWNEVKVIFENLTALKQRDDSINIELVPEIPGAYFTVKGKPALTRLSLFIIGIVNPSDKGTDQPVSGSVWINELRVLGADDTPGWAYTSSASIRFADLMTVNMNMSRTDPYFHRLADRFGSRTDTKNWGASFDVDVLKLLPFNMPGGNLRLNYARTESSSDPLYVPGTDIKVDQAAKQISDQMIINGASAEEAASAAKKYITEAQTVNVSNTYTLSQIKLKLPSDYWLIRDSFNSLTFSFSYNNTKGRNPSVVKSESWSWNASVSHSVSLSPSYFFYPADIPVLGSFIEIFADYRNVKFFYTPQSITSGIQARRSYGFSLLRPTPTSANPQASISRDFTATRNAAFSWKLTEGGFLNPALSYSTSANSTLLFLLTRNNIERPESQIWKDIFSGTLFGKDLQYSQRVEVKTNPKLPALWSISKYITLNGGYGVNYSWNNNLAQEELGRSAGYANNISTGLTLKLKSLFEPLFKDVSESSKNKTSNTAGGGRGRNTGSRTTTPAVTDTTKPAAISDSTAAPSTKGLGLQRVYLLLKGAFHWTLIDYESISINFSQDNTMSGGGLYGRGTGFSNFWNVLYDPKSGPTRSFMLGLSNDLGRRAPNGQLSNVFTQNNKVDFSTSRPLWEGAQIKLKWNVGWSLNKTTKINTDAFGNQTINSLTSSGTISRSFFTMPPVFIFSMFNSGMKKVFELYDPKSANTNEAMADAFINGFESFPLLAKSGFFKDLAKYIPRPNWDLNWDGLEKFSLFESFAKKVSLTHSYSSNIQEGWNIDNYGLKTIQSEKINYGFAPLIGLNMTFNSLWDGNMSGNIRYSTKSSFDLQPSNKKITESYSNDIGITASYSKSGFEWPLFGLSLKNDIEVSLSYTSGRTSSILYDMVEENENGVPQDGTVRTSMEPRLKYVISSKVTLSVFYRRTTVEPEGASHITPTTTNEMGLDIHISIQ